MSPPAAPNWQLSRKETIDDLTVALKTDSLPLLVAALGRAHACRGRSCGNADHSLHEALQMEHLEAVKFLLKHAPESLHDTCSGMLPLTRAISIGIHNGDKKYVLASLLLQHGANPNSKSGLNGDTALHVAASCGAINAVKLLLEFGADYDARNADLLTPLHAACRTTLIPPCTVKDRVVACLLEHGANPTVLDKWGHQPVDYVCQFGGLRAIAWTSKEPWCPIKTMDHMLRAIYLFNRTQLLLARGHDNDDNILQKLPFHLLDSVLNYL